ncbi:MAG TPA: 2'-deoxycytidine 5'-triphosphate deaminase [Acidimicrobiales bacterium]|nr:2'-deoxycytidine 5'-triphosphate deaminase [Acidimicrobiales bacterium]
MPDPLGLSDLRDAAGVLPNQLLAEAVTAGWIEAGDFRVPEENIQPASLDLRLGEQAFRMRCSFLPHDDAVERKVKDYIVDELDLRREGAVLETNRPYLIPLLERVHLPPHVSARANPKSSTGRLDVFTRVITDHSYKFDDVQPGYDGPLYLEVVPLSFAVRVRQGLSLNQLRLSVGSASLTDDELWDVHQEDPLLFKGGKPAGREDFVTDDGLFLSLDLRGDAERNVGWRARGNAGLLDMSKIGIHRINDYWEAVRSEDGDRVVLDPERFYLLLSDEAVRVPPHLASEMTAYDPTSGELRTHYAGFFDPGFGHGLDGSRAALEVRAHDVPFMIEHGQRVCRLTFERMVAEPTKLYGGSIGSNYQGQLETLGKHFERPAS